MADSSQKLTTAVVSDADLVAFMGECRRERVNVRHGEGIREVVTRQLNGFRPLHLARRLMEKSYTRMEYLDFLVDCARDEGNPVEFRRECYQALDKICLMVGASHPKVAKELLEVYFMSGPEKRDRRRRVVAKLGRGPARKVGREGTGSRFAEYLRERVGDNGES
jgi:hypothetical protein